MSGLNYYMPLTLGFAGVGWIGLSRLTAIRLRGVAEKLICFEPDAAQRRRVTAELPEAIWVSSYEELLGQGAHGIVIATPSALHSAQCSLALRSGHAVFCQKPLARTADETRSIVETARLNNHLLGCDFSYRHTAAVRRISERLRAGAIGRPFALDLVFHNAYGPDKDWYHDKQQSGGGCVMDLGVHLVDLALYLLDFPSLHNVSSRLLTEGKPMQAEQTEDYAEVQLDLASEVVVRLTCSWRVHAGRDAVIEARVYGCEGGLCLRNLEGSFYDFVAEEFHGTQSESLIGPPDDWSGRAAAEWASRLAQQSDFDPLAQQFVRTAEAMDAIYVGASR